MGLFKSASPGLIGLVIFAGGLAHASAPDVLTVTQMTEMNDETQRLLENVQKSSLTPAVKNDIGLLAQSTSALSECYRQNTGSDLATVCKVELGNTASSWDAVAANLNTQQAVPSDLSEVLAQTQKSVTGVINSAFSGEITLARRHDRDEGRWRRGRDRDDWRWRHGHDRDDWRWRGGWDRGGWYYPPYRDPYYRCYRDIFFRWNCPWN